MGTKHQIWILKGLAVLLFIFALFQCSKKKEIEANFEQFRLSSDRYIKKELINQKKQITDSLLSDFNSLPPDTIIKTKIQYKYETIIDSVLVYPTAEQYEYSSSELDRLYPD